MPLYEYLCEKCGSKFELIEKFSSEPKTVHEGCGGSVHRLISAPALQFKGSGWYITDYAKSGSSSTGSEAKKAGEAKESKSSSSSSDSSSTSTPAAPATKTTTTTTAAPAPSSSSSSSSSDSGGGSKT